MRLGNGINEERWGKVSVIHRAGERPGKSWSAGPLQFREGEMSEAWGASGTQI